MTTPTTWPGKAWGVRAPEANETPLSEDEALTLLIDNPAKLEKLDLLPEYDHINTWPVRRRFRPARSWGIHTPGLRHAQPFDGLVGI